MEVGGACVCVRACVRKERMKKDRQKEKRKKEREKKRKSSKITQTALKKQIYYSIDLLEKHPVDMVSVAILI